MVAEMRCVTSLYRAEVGSRDSDRYLCRRVVGETESYLKLLILKQALRRLFSY